MYKEKRISCSEFVPIRGLRYHVQRWGAAQTQASQLPLLVLVHGWMDVAASYQFMVDALSEAFTKGRTIIAPDWRGFGLTKPIHTDENPDCYWFPDYLGDLDFLLDHYAPAQQVDLVGHSMGGNVAMMYAGARPKRIRKLVNMEGFGLPPSEPSRAPGQYALWMDGLKSLHRGALDLKPYNDLEGVTRRLMKTNPRLTQDKAAWLAGKWAQPNAAGKWEIQGAAAHKVPGAQLYRVDEALELYRSIKAPTLAIEASDNLLSKLNRGTYTLADYHERLKNIAQSQVAVIQDAGHMVQHDQPEQLARLIENFLD